MKRSDYDETCYEVSDGEVIVFANAGNTITLIVDPDDHDVPVALTADDARELAALLVCLADEVSMSGKH